MFLITIGSTHNLYSRSFIISNGKISLSEIWVIAMTENGHEQILSKQAAVKWKPIFIQRTFSQEYLSF